MKSMREMINLMEGVMAVPGLNTINRQVDEKAPKGWEGTVKAMKKHSEIDNPWALAHYMKNKGYKSHKEEESVGVEEKAPPGEEDLVMKLKKEYPGHPEKAFATAWSIYNKKHGKAEEGCMEEINGTPDVDLCRQSNPAAARDACHMEEQLMYPQPGQVEEAYESEVQDVIGQLEQLSGLGYTEEDAFEQIAAALANKGYGEEDINHIFHAVDHALGTTGHDDLSPGGEDGAGYTSDDAVQGLAFDGSDDEMGDGERPLEPWEAESQEYEEDVLGPVAEHGADSTNLGKALKQLTDVLASGRGIHVMHAIPQIARMNGINPKALSDLYYRHIGREQSKGMEFEEAYDLNNGYEDIDNANPQNYFPTGADSPVVTALGGNAKSGDNPEQKRVAVAKESADIHKELVYRYRDYLNETAEQPKKKDN